MDERAVGFIGLGNIGALMAERFVEAGHQLTGFDAAGTEERLPSGAIAASSVEEIAASTDTVCLSLPGGTASKEVCSQMSSARERRVQTVVDLSTIGVSGARECATLLESEGIAYADAPVGGGLPGARSGSLTVMVGAKRTVLDEVQSLLLSTIAKNVYHMGYDPGQGQLMKLLNNFLVATALAATSEAAVFGVREGLDLARMIDVINSCGTGQNTATVDKFPKSVIPDTYDYGFAASLMNKDVALYLEDVETAGAPHKVGETVARVWQDFNKSFPDKDFTYIYKYLEEL